MHTTKSFPPLAAGGCICLRKPLDLSEHENTSLSTLMCSEGITRGGLGTVFAVKQTEPNNEMGSAGLCSTLSSTSFCLSLPRLHRPFKRI